jgi:hypothetical protein
LPLSQYCAQRIRNAKQAANHVAEYGNRKHGHKLVLRGICAQSDVMFRRCGQSSSSSSSKADEVCSMICNEHTTDAQLCQLCKTTEKHTAAYHVPGYVQKRCDNQGHTPSNHVHSLSQLTLHARTLLSKPAEPRQSSTETKPIALPPKALLLPFWRLSLT